MIFKQGSCEQELFEGMQQAQQDTLTEEIQQQGQSIYEALQLLNNAAECFERVGRISRAEEVTAVMISLADSKIDKSEKSKSKNEAAEVFKYFGFKPKDLGLAE
jgi:hypothetical protein